MFLQVNVTTIKSQKEARRDNFGARATWDRVLLGSGHVNGSARPAHGNDEEREKNEKLARLPLFRGVRNQVP